MGHLVSWIAAIVLVMGIVGIVLGFAAMLLRAVLRFMLALGAGVIVWFVGEEFIRRTLRGGRE